MDFTKEELDFITNDEEIQFNIDELGEYIISIISLLIREDKIRFMHSENDIILYISETPWFNNLYYKIQILTNRTLRKYFVDTALNILKMPLPDTSTINVIHEI